MARAPRSGLAAEAGRFSCLPIKNSLAYWAISTQQDVTGPQPLGQPSLNIELDDLLELAGGPRAEDDPKFVQAALNPGALLALEGSLMTVVMICGLVPIGLLALPWGAGRQRSSGQQPLIRLPNRWSTS